MINCTQCGKFVSYADLDSGKAKYIFTPDSEFECEETIFLCRACTLKEYGEDND
jgi:hypothetical protein